MMEKTTLESLARMVNDGFEEAKKDRVGIRAEMKEGFDNLRKELRSEMNKGFDDLQSEIRNRPTYSELKEEIAKVTYAKEIDDVRSRVNVCERKLGIERPQNFILEDRGDVV